MARIRSIKVDQYLDDGLSGVSLEAHFLLLGLPCLADSAGRLEDRPRKIHALLFAYRPEVKVDALLSELVRSGHIQRYTDTGEAYIQILDWDKDQRPHKNEPESSIPPPPQLNTSVGHAAVPGIHDSTQGILEKKSAAGVWGVGSEVRDPDPDPDSSPDASAPAVQVDLLPPAADSPTPPDKPPKRGGRVKRSNEPPDPRHHPLKLALVAAGWPFDGGRDAGNLTAILALADQQEATRGENAAAEVLRRAAIAWAQFPGFYSARTLGGLRTKWGDVAQPAAQGQQSGRPRDLTRGMAHAEDMVYTGKPGDELTI